jgi:hypothetical protein
MSTSVFGRLHNLLFARPDSGIEYVLGSNGLGSVALGVCLWLKLDLDPVWALVFVAASFVLLTGCLLYRPTVFIAAALGAAINAGIGGFVLGAMSENLHPLAPWVVGPLAAAGIAAATIWAYVSVARAARAPRA